MWTKSKSLFLSKLLTTITMIFIIAMTVFIPAISSLYNKYSVVYTSETSHETENSYPTRASSAMLQEYSLPYGIIEMEDITIPTCIMLYICEALALTALIFLHILLSNITKNKVFIEQNTLCIRIISWVCIGAGALFFGFSAIRFVFLAPAFLAFMFGIVMRVLKNVFEQAVEIKSENDFTI